MAVPLSGVCKRLAIKKKKYCFYLYMYFALDKLPIYGHITFKFNLSVGILTVYYNFCLKILLY